MDWVLGLFGGAGISFIVSLLKRIPVIGKYPKVFVAILGVVLEVIHVGLFNAPSAVTDIIAQLIATFSASVATYEVITKPVTSAVKVTSTTP